MDCKFNLSCCWCSSPWEWIFYRNQVYSCFGFKAGSVLALCQMLWLILSCLILSETLWDIGSIFSPILQITKPFSLPRTQDELVCPSAWTGKLHMPVTLGSSRLSQEDYELQANLATLCDPVKNKQKIPSLLIWVDLPIGSEIIGYEPRNGHCLSNGHY